MGFRKGWIVNCSLWRYEWPFNFIVSQSPNRFHNCWLDKIFLDLFELQTLGFWLWAWQNYMTMLRDQDYLEDPHNWKTSASPWCPWCQGRRCTEWPSCRSGWPLPGSLLLSASAPCCCCLQHPDVGDVGDGTHFGQITQCLDSNYELQIFAINYYLKHFLPLMIWSVKV